MAVDLSKLNFWSGVNYMKRYDDESPYTDVTLASGASQTLTINHALGNIPEYDVQAELEGNGRIWSGSLPYVGMNQGGPGPTNVYFNSWIDTANLTIVLQNPTGGSVSFRVYHIIYKDYA